ncbi:MAG: WD40 repeat domain-containing protein, partial [Caldilineaceae bacterium]|nr:WD40 repeat domain-containing protein [Caldilineaceae bacterium]
FGGHTAAVVDVRFAPDGSHALTVSKDGTARLWNLATGNTVHTFGVRSRATAGTGYHPLTSGAFSPDGAYLILGDESYRAQLWDVASGVLLRVFEGHSQAVRAVAFAPNGTQVVTGGALHDNTLRLWNTANGTLIRTFSGHDVRELNDGAISPDGAQILTGACDETARLWNVNDGAQLHSFPGHFDEVPCAMAVQFSADGVHALTTTSLNAYLWDLATHTKVRTFSGHRFAMNSATLSPDGSQLLTTGSDRSPARCSQDCAQAKLWDTADGTLLHTLVHPTVLYDAVFSADGRLVMTVGLDQAVRLWSAPSGQLLRTIEVHTGAVWAAAFSPDGTHLLTGGDDQTALLLDLASSTVVHTFQHPAKVSAVAFHPDGALVAVAAGWNVYLWDAQQGGLVAVVGHGDAVQSVDFSADGTQLLTTAWDGAAKLWAVVF